MSRECLRWKFLAVGAALCLQIEIVFKERKGGKSQSSVNIYHFVLFSTVCFTSALSCAISSSRRKREDGNWLNLPSMS